MLSHYSAYTIVTQYEHKRARVAEELRAETHHHSMYNYAQPATALPLSSAHDFAVTAPTGRRQAQQELSKPFDGGETGKPHLGGPSDASVPIAHRAP